MRSGKQQKSSSLLYKVVKFAFTLFALTEATAIAGKLLNNNEKFTIQFEYQPCFNGSILQESVNMNLLSTDGVNFAGVINTVAGNDTWTGILTIPGAAAPNIWIDDTAQAEVHDDVLVCRYPYRKFNYVILPFLPLEDGIYTPCVNSAGEPLFPFDLTHFDVCSTQPNKTCVVKDAGFSCEVNGIISKNTNAAEKITQLTQHYSKRKIRKSHANNLINTNEQPQKFTINCEDVSNDLNSNFICIKNECVTYSSFIVPPAANTTAFYDGLYGEMSMPNKTTVTTGKGVAKTFQYPWYDYELSSTIFTCEYAVNATLPWRNAHNPFQPTCELDINKFITKSPIFPANDANYTMCSQNEFNIVSVETDGPTITYERYDLAATLGSGNGRWQAEECDDLVLIYNIVNNTISITLPTAADNLRESCLIQYDGWLLDSSTILNNAIFNIIPQNATLIQPQNEVCQNTTQNLNLPSIYLLLKVLKNESKNRLEIIDLNNNGGSCNRDRSSDKITYIQTESPKKI